MSFPSLGVCFHFTSAMANSFWAHLQLHAPVCMSVGEIEANPYDLGTHTESWESHHQFTLVCVELSSYGHQLASFISSSVSLPPHLLDLRDLGAFSRLPWLVN